MPRLPHLRKEVVVGIDGTRTEKYLTHSNTTASYGFSSPLEGMPYEERFYDSSN